MLNKLLKTVKKSGDYKQMLDFQNRLQATLPFRIRPRQDLISLIAEQGLSAPKWIEVEDVIYTGDDNDITLILEPVDTDGGFGFAVSITLVEFDPNHELAAEVADYQRHRSPQKEIENQEDSVPDPASASVKGKTSHKKRRSRKTKAKKTKGFGSPK